MLMAWVAVVVMVMVMMPMAMLTTIMVPTLMEDCHNLCLYMGTCSLDRKRVEINTSLTGQSNLSMRWGYETPDRGASILTKASYDLGRTPNQLSPWMNGEVTGESR